MLLKYPNLNYENHRVHLYSCKPEDYKSEDIKVAARLVLVALQAQNSPKEVENLQTN